MGIARVSAKKLFRFGVLAAMLAGLWIAALYLAAYVETNEMARNLVADIGYLGVFVMAIIAGLNVLLPVPAATFTPVFLSAGLWLPLVILMLVIGTTIADLIGYFIGRWGRDFTEYHYPRTYAHVLKLSEHKRELLLPFVFVYAAFVPFPNEAIIIPLALVGVRFTFIIIPLVLGTTVHQTVLALGAANIFTLLF